MAIDATEAHSDAGRKPRRSRRFWLLRVAIAIALLVVLTEIGLRVILGLGSPLLYQPDPYCKYFVKPNQNLRRFFAHNRINSEGMRSDEFAMPRPKDRVARFCIGDSVTYGTTSVDQSLIFTTLLTSSLPPIEHRPVEVLNASAGGWAIDNEVNYLLSRGTFDSNVVFLVLNTGDPGQPSAPWQPSLGSPTERPWTAIGETWFRYAEPRIFGQRLAADAGTVLPSMEEEVTTSLENQKLLQQANAFCQKNNTVFGIIYIPFPAFTGPVAETCARLTRRVDDA